MKQEFDFSKLNLKDVKGSTWAGLVALVLALINQVLVSNGVTITGAPTTYADWYVVATNLVTIAAAIAGFWYNNNFTGAAQLAQYVLEQLKGGELHIERTDDGVQISNKPLEGKENETK